MGIVDKKKQELTNQAKKKIIKLIKPYLIGAIIFMLIAAVFFVAVTSIADKMKSLINVAATFVSNIWKWITDDYWIDLTKEIDVEYTDSDGNTITESRTLMDHYMYQLDELGISLKDLRLLGDADYSDPNLLEDPENKAKVQKYLKAFVVADLITSQIHRRNSNELVYKPSTAITGIIGQQIANKDDILSDKIDGGIYLYRTKDVTSVSNNSTTTNSNTTETGDNLANCYRMEYIELEKFKEKVETFNTAITGTGRGDIEKYFTIDEDGNLLIAQVDGYVETEKVKRGFFDESQYEGESSYTAVEKKIDYKKEVAQYTLPYEFLIDLCMVTENPEFVYHVAEMSLNTNISLLIQNNETTVVDEEVQNGMWVKEKKDESGDITEEESENYTRTKTRVTTTTNPILKVKGVNTWSTYKKIEWRDRVLQKENTNQLPGTYSDSPGEWTYVPEYEPNAIEDPSGTIQGHDEYWTREYFKDYTITKTHITVTNNYYSIEGNLIRKSDNFLGLLRNKTGKYIEGTTPDFKVDGCKFDRNGINVRYQIPGRSIYEDPLSRLKSGEKMLYSILKRNERTEPLVELMQYYMTFPEQEYYDLTEQEVEDILGGYNNNNNTDNYVGSDYIVKTDEPGALKAVTKEELIKIINATLSGKQKENALSIVDTLIKCQDEYKVNAVFVLAFARAESSVGTANTTHVKNNNWLSWQLGRKYPSPQNNVEIVMRSIANGSIYFSTGKYTISEIGHTYCPNMPEYPTQGDKWVENVTNYVKDMYSKIGVRVEETVNTQINNKIVKQAAECMQYLVDNEFKYEYGGTPSFPIYGKTKGTIDCSGYVSWVLYELGYLNGRWTSATFANNPKGWKKITNKADVKAGDIVVYKGHVEICAEDVTGDASKITKYNVGSTKSIYKSPYSSSWHSNFICALRIIE